MNETKMNKEELALRDEIAREEFTRQRDYSIKRGAGGYPSHTARLCFEFADAFASKRMERTEQPDPETIEVSDGTHEPTCCGCCCGGIPTDWDAKITAIDSTCDELSELEELRNDCVTLAAAHTAVQEIFRELDYPAVKANLAIPFCDAQATAAKYKETT